MRFPLPILPLLAVCSIIAVACTGEGGSGVGGSGGGAGHGHGGDGGDGGDGHGGGGHGGTGGYAEDPAAAEACIYLKDGPAAPVTAAINPLDAPPIDADGHRYDVAFVDFGGGSYGGTVAFAAPAASDYVLFLGTDVGVVIEGPGGELVSVHHRNPGSDACPGIIASSLNIPMSTGSHTLSFGPTSAAAVSIVIEPSQAPSP